MPELASIKAFALQVHSHMCVMELYTWYYISLTPSFNHHLDIHSDKEGMREHLQYLGSTISVEYLLPTMKYLSTPGPNGLAELVPDKKIRRM